MSYFTALTDNNKFITPCDKVYSIFPTEIDLFPGYNSKCCCGVDDDLLLCKPTVENYKFFTEKNINKKCYKH